MTDNGNPDTCETYDEDYKPWFYAGIDITVDQGDEGDVIHSQDNRIESNLAWGNLGCVPWNPDAVPCPDADGQCQCKARQRDFWDENPENNNHWVNNSVVNINAPPEYSPTPVD